MKKSMLVFALAATIVGCSKNTEEQSPASHWDYEHPEWQNEGYTDCGGKVESPINIDTSRTIKAHMPSITFNYNPFNFRIVDNGHTIQVINTGNNKLTLDGTVFDFKQLHFHHTGEHGINGKKGDLELHLVHNDSATGNLMVLAVIIKEGAENNAIAKIWASIPSVKEKEMQTNISLNLNDLLPADTKYYTYVGSLTTPPCTDGIEWVILKQPLTMSKAQIETFTHLYQDNARPLQALNNRYVLEAI